MSPRTALLPLLLLALAACGGAVDGPVTSPTGPATGPGSPTAGADDPAGGARLALPPRRAVHDDVAEPAPRSFEEALWDETDDSLHVIYTTGVEPCYVLAGVEVEEDADQVTVTLSEGYLPDEDGEPPVCIQVAERVSTPVPLTNPLDGRTVVDGATGEPVPVSVIDAADAPSS